MAAIENTSRKSGKRLGSAVTADELSKELDRARSSLASGSLELRERLNPVSAIQHSISAHPGRWLAASAIGGLLAARILVSGGRSRKDSRKNDRQRAGLPLAAILGLIARTTFNLAKPAATRLVQKRLNELVD